MQTDSTFNIWTDEAAETVAATPIVALEVVEEFEPLDAQFGVAVPKSCPDTVFTHLFGQPELDAAEIARFGGAGTVPHMQLYVVCDASKLQNGFDEIEACGLPYKCLFTGEAERELRDVAPYLIELSPDAILTRRLFTFDSNTPEALTTLHMWHKDPGILIRSRASFDAVWRHLRKFTRVQDDTGKWIYFRFYEPSYFQKLLASFEPEQVDAFFSDVVHEVIATYRWVSPVFSIIRRQS